MDLRKILTSLTPATSFPTFQQISRRIDSLLADFPELILADTIGFSREGRPLHRLVVGSGTRHAVVIGMPHPNEPTGAVGALAIADLLCRNDRLRTDLGLTWHIVPCADPDGTVLNESWFAGPFSRQSYSSGIYRPPLMDDVEWTFRREELPEPGLASTPESRAVMALIDGVRPELLVSMHNAEAGGLYMYVTHDSPSIADGFQQTSLLTGIPVDHGLPEAPANSLAPGIFCEKPALAGGPIIGSTDYAAKYDTFSALIEPPLWIAPDVSDSTATRITAADIYSEIECERDVLRTEYSGWLDRLGRPVPSDSARWRAVQFGTEQLAHAWKPVVDAGRNLTVAEISSVKRHSDLERLRLAGHLVAALRDSPEGVSEADRTVQHDALAALERWSRDAIGGRFCGLDASVAAHVGIALTCAEAMRDRQ